MRAVYINRLSKFLPNEPVSNDEMESILGVINNRPSKARAIVLRNNGIKQRYYALKDGKSTHSHIEITANAVKGLFDNELPISTLGLLATGTATSEQILPSHAAMVHGELGIHPIEIIAASGSCCSGMQALKHAFMAVYMGMVEVAVATGSEKVSSWMHASRFEPETENLQQLEKDPYIAFEKDFLRWMLSDGAGAALLQGRPNKEGISLRIDWLEIISYANEIESCMYAGALKNEDASLTGWNEMPMEEWGKQSVFSIKQDTKLLNQYIIRQGRDFLEKLVRKYDLKSDEIDYYVPHMSSEFFKKQIYDSHKEMGFDIPLDKWFYNLTQVGNVGSASPFLMLEELFNSGQLKKGQKLLIMVPESARFSYAYMHLTVV